MNEKSRYDKVYGALMGVAVGDAMGMPAEQWPRSKIKKVLGKIETFVAAPAENPVTRGLKAGEVTDDTLMTQAVADAIIEQEGRIVPERIIAHIMAWAMQEKTQNCNFIGPSTQKAFDAMKRGLPIAETGKSGVTNGGAMRIIPVGLISDWQNPDLLADNVRQACLATHHTNIAIAGAAGIAAAASYGLRGGDDWDRMIAAAQLACEKGMNLGYEMAGPSISKRIDLAVEIVRSGRTEEEILQNIYDIIGTGLAVAESVPAALSLVYWAQGDPIRCARLAANVGGDTDTIGAMSCGICGAFQGIGAFPADYVKLIEETNHLDLAATAHKLLKYAEG